MVHSGLSIDLEFGKGFLELLDTLIGHFRPMQEEFLEVFQPLQVLKTRVGNLGPDQTQDFESLQLLQMRQACIRDLGIDR